MLELYDPATEQPAARPPGVVQLAAKRFLERL